MGHTHHEGSANNTAVLQHVVYGKANHGEREDMQGRHSGLWTVILLEVRYYLAIADNNSTMARVKANKVCLHQHRTRLGLSDYWVGLVDRPGSVYTETDLGKAMVGEGERVHDRY